MFELSSLERERLQDSIAAALSVPFIAGVEGYVFEALFHFVKNLPLPNPHATKRSKTLFDCVDASQRIGWSLKSVQKNPSSNSFELVIQRADIIKKRQQLELPDLNLDSSPERLGEGILKHWTQKITGDMERQGVRSARVAVLLKSNNHRRYAFLEQEVRLYQPEELSWSWTDDTHTGLQARHANDGQIVFRWYPNQKQLFENFNLPQQAFRFEVQPTRLSVPSFLERMQS
jgi:hypothetical protein